MQTVELVQLHAAAVDGDDDALCQLGNCYFDGIGVEQSLADALMLYELARLKGNRDAEANLQLCREFGIDVGAIAVCDRSQAQRAVW